MKMYKCPQCGLTLTENELDDLCDAGFARFCYCKFNNARSYIEYKTYDIYL